MKLYKINLVKSRRKTDLLISKYVLKVKIKKKGRLRHSKKNVRLLNILK